jgi:hypothetical protein
LQKLTFLTRICINKAIENFLTTSAFQKGKLKKVRILKVLYPEMVCQLRPFMYSKGLNIALSISFTIVKLGVKTGGLSM